jgi:anthranilate/para-aminobenzoate synthase component I
MSDPIQVRIQATPAPFAPPLAAYEALAARFGRDQVFLLESLAGPDADMRWSMIGFRPLLTVTVLRGRVDFAGVPDLAETIRARVAASGTVALDADGGMTVPEAGAEGAGDLWAMLRAVEACFQVERPAELRFAFGFFGSFGYDTVRYVEKLPRRIEAGPDVPEVVLSLFQGLLRLDFADRRATLTGAQCPLLPTPDLGGIVAALAACGPVDETAPPVPAPLSVTDSTDEATYSRGVGRALEHILDGDIYQVQLGHDLTIESEATPETVYRRLRARNPAPYMVLARIGGMTLAGASPEVFVRIEQGQVLMRPLAGTIPRGKTEDEDVAAAKRLAEDPKEIAEHVMLVDLCRNDIGRICQAESLAVPVLLATERYSHVHHLVSTVTARAETGTDIWDVIAATFPAGTMTGAPKIRAMEIIEDLETSRRGQYAGAFGLIDFGGDAELALCIRTAVHDGKSWSIRASAGVVADSVPEKEWRETLAKLGASYWAITGEELRP